MKYTNPFFLRHILLLTLIQNSPPINHVGFVFLHGFDNNRPQLFVSFKPKVTVIVLFLKCYGITQTQANCGIQFENTFLFLFKQNNENLLSSVIFYCGTHKVKLYQSSQNINSVNIAKNQTKI